MISAMTSSAVSSAMQMPPPKSQEKLSDDQRQLISETLEKFDAEALTEEDAQSIIAAFEAAGIEPGQEMAELMAEAGFDAKEVGDLAGVEGPPEGGQRPPPPPADMESASLNMSSDTAEELNSLLDQYFTEGASTDEKDSTLAAMQAIFEASAPESGLINQYA